MQKTLISFFSPASKQSGSPLQNVREWVDDHRYGTNWKDIDYQDFHPPATQEKRCYCGIWETWGCLCHDEHEKLGKGKRDYVKQFQRTCYRASCEECYWKWIARQANVATKRIEKYMEKSAQKPIHLILSVPSSQHNLPYAKIKQRMKMILKKAKWKGGAVIFHPFKFYKTKDAYISPHFHLLGFGNQQNISEAFGKFGWFIKIVDDERESVFATFCYMLKHCGIKKGNHTVTWIGELSYDKLKVEKEPKITKCPVCGRKFIQIYYDGIHPVVPPDKNYEGLVDSDGGWYPVITEPEITNSKEFEFHPIKYVNDVLKGLCINLVKYSFIFVLIPFFTTFRLS